MPDRSYVPALGFDWLTRLYDPLLALTLREETLKGRPLDQAGIAWARSGMREIGTARL